MTLYEWLTECCDYSAADAIEILIKYEKDADLPKETLYDIARYIKHFD